MLIFTHHHNHQPPSTITIKTTKIQIIIPVILIFIFINSALSTCPATGCATCRDANDCQTCTTGYGLSITISPPSRSCLACLGSCQLCYNNVNICEKCAIPLGVTIAGTCGNCADPACSNCQINQSICSVCNSSTLRTGLSTVNNTCSSCIDIYCKNCTLNINICVQCDLLYGVDVQNYSCVLCGSYDSKCENCQNNVTICTKCVSGFGVNATGGCSTCVNTLCQLCSFGVNLCTKCIDTYGLNGGNCVHCTAINCADCTGNISGCVKCSDGFGFDATNACSACTNPLCLYCFASNIVCTGCITNYGWNSVMNSCSPCSTSCQTCDPQNYTTCTSCRNSSYLTAPTCSSCTPNCHNCTNNTLCLQCNPNYYLNNNDTICTICPHRCIECFLNIMYNLPQCYNCTTNNGSEFDDHVPVTCREICGDGTTGQHPCDNRYHHQYDGCTSGCQIQANFNCTVINGISTCSYNTTLQLQLLSFTRQKFTNTFTTQIHIFPPLYIFSLINQTQLKQIFLIDNTNFMVQTANYDPLTSVLTLTGQLRQTNLDIDGITIRYNPDPSIRLQYYASIQTTLIFNLNITMYYYTEFTLNLAKYMKYLCICLVGLGWVGVVLGVILRKLAGLQAMFVLQFCWFTIVYVNCDMLLLFQEISNMKYSAGYNYIDMSMVANNSVSMPYLSYFKLSSNSLASNYNITPLAIQTLALIFLIITLIKLKLFIKNHPSLQIQIDQNQEIKRQFQQIVNTNQFVYQVLLSSCMLFFIYYIFCSTLYFKYTQFNITTLQNTNTNIFSLAIFIVTALITISTLIKFYIDPCTFDYFRYSFCITQLAMHHYFIYVFVFAITIVLLVSVPQVSFAPLIPLLLLLIYTLSYRPYKQLKQNLRAGFNVLTMCSFASFRIYLKSTPKSHISSNNTSIYFFINFLILIPLVLLFTYISIIYSYYHDLSLQHQNQNIKNTRYGRYQDRTRKILIELGIISVNKKLIQQQDKCKQQNTFRQVLDNFDNLHNISNQLHQQYLREQMRKIQYNNNGSNSIDVKYVSINRNNRNINSSNSNNKEGGNQNNIVDIEGKTVQLPQNIQTKLMQYHKYKVNVKKDKIKRDKIKQKIQKCKVKQQQKQQQKLNQNDQDDIVNNFYKLGKQLQMDTQNIQQNFPQQKIINTINNTNNHQVSKFLSITGLTLLTSPTNNEIVEQILTQQNKYVNLRSAIEQVQIDMNMSKNIEEKIQAQIYMKQFMNINKL